jgi:hypothetical protein
MKTFICVSEQIGIMLYLPSKPNVFKAESGQDGLTSLVISPLNKWVESNIIVGLEP